MALQTQLFVGQRTKLEQEANAADMLSSCTRAANNVPTPTSARHLRRHIFVQSSR